jgi:heme-binding protein
MAGNRIGSGICRAFIDADRKGLPATCRARVLEEFAMTITAARLRHGLAAVFAATAAGGAAVFALSVQAAPSATAALDPCAASEVAKTIGAVATQTGAYLDTHPQTNAALTAISQQQAGPSGASGATGGLQSLVALKAYFDANPQAEKDIQGLQSPLVGLSARCKLPLTLPQVLGLMQGAPAQAGAGAAASLPNALSAAQSATAPGAAAAVPSSAATAVTQGAGPLPGPSPRATG